MAVARFVAYLRQWGIVTQEGSPPSHAPGGAGAEADVYLQAVAVATDREPARAALGFVRGPLPSAGQVLAGRYRVERLLGAGGMGIVVAARHIHLDAPVALKFMSEETAAEPHLVARFLREARATARLRGEHVVRVSDVGELDSGAPYMVMEHLQGQDLSALLTSLGPPPIASAVEYAIQACEGLDEAHRAGFVHRDVKPSNLFLTRRPNGTACIKVVDFGISKAVSMTEPETMLHVTSTRAIFGSPLYMAPEQMRAARDVDGRADLWSLGASLYELLSGSVPFVAESIVDLAYRIANESPPSLRARRPEIPYGLERIVFRCLERDRNHRFPDARSLAVALEEFRFPSAWELLAGTSEEDQTRIMDPPVLSSATPVPTPTLAGVSAPVPTPAFAGVSAPAPASEESPPSDPSLVAPDTASLTPLESLAAPAGPEGARAERSSVESVTTSSVSWGQRSQRPAHGRARTLVAHAALGTAAVVAIALAGMMLFRTRDDAAPVRPTVASTLSGALGPQQASAVSLVPLEALEAPTGARAPTASTGPKVPTVAIAPTTPTAPAAETAPTIPPAPTAPTPTEGASAEGASAEVRTVSVMDLPAAPLPTVAPPAPVALPKPIATPAAAPPRPARVNCSPPFVYDELGLKIFKPDCVN